MPGVGFGMMFLSALVMVNFYFDKRRALANGISVCGAGIGTFVMAPFVNFLVSEYGWKVRLQTIASKRKPRGIYILSFFTFFLTILLLLYVHNIILYYFSHTVS